MRISGWMRLFILLSILWSIVILLGGWWFLYQSTSKIYRSWFSQLEQQAYFVIGSQIVRDKLEINPNLTTKQQIKLLENMLAEQRRDYVQNCKNNPNDFCNIPFVDDEIRKKYEFQLSKINSNRILLFIFILWILPLLLVYLLSSGIYWVHVDLCKNSLKQIYTYLLAIKEISCNFSV
jgi:H+/Cl- antiporter ClcA